MFRTLVIKRTSKLSLLRGYLLIYDGEKETKVLISELSCLILESNRISMTSPLLLELIQQNVSVIICDEKHNPAVTVLGLNNFHSQLTALNIQLAWKEETKMLLWQEIVKSKISLQAEVMKMFGFSEYSKLEGYIDEIKGFDYSNREGIAAKEYFSVIFGKSFSREQDSLRNTLLNYGYAMILSCFNRELVSHGYLTQLGIFHKGPFNSFNLSSDFMEPFRPIVDILVMLFLNSDFPKKEIRKLLSKRIKLNGEERYLDNAISVYTTQLLNILKNNKVVFPKIELLERNAYLDADQSDANNCNVWCQLNY